MIEIICGQKGKGKTKVLLDKVNEQVKSANGDMVYIDKSSKHMYELDTKIRLINLCDYPISDTDECIGFICGIISQNADIETICLDSFLTIAYVDSAENLAIAIEKLDVISNKFNVNFVLSVSKSEDELPEVAKSKVVVSL